MGSALAGQGCDLESPPQQGRLLTYGRAGQLGSGGLISHFGMDYKTMFETWVEYLDLLEMLENMGTT